MATLFLMISQEIDMSMRPTMGSHTEVLNQFLVLVMKMITTWMIVEQVIAANL